MVSTYCTSCASMLVIVFAQQSSHLTPPVRWLKAPLAIQKQHRPLSHSSRALLPASSARSLAAQASEPLLLLPAGGRDRRRQLLGKIQGNAVRMGRSAHHESCSLQCEDENVSV
jgi:hypothetical protein